MIFLRQKFAPASLSALDKVKSLIQLIAGKPVSLWHRLTTAERLYAIASLLLIFTSNWYGLIAIIATVALSIEFWPIFTRMWHSLAGKAIILLFYAVIANFALVSASSVVNEVVGVSADSLTYTHNFAILLYLPIWLFGITVVVLALMQMGLPIYLLLLLVLKPFGMKGVRLVAKSDYPVIVALIRLVMSFIVLFHLILLTDAESEFTEAKFDDVLKRNLGVQIEEGLDGHQIDLALGNKVNHDVISDAQVGEDKTKKSSESETQVLRFQPQLLQQEPSKSEPPLSESPDSKQATDEVAASSVIEQEDEQANGSEEKAESPTSIVDRYLTFSKRLIAEFAFKLESDEFSRCEISEGANIIELNDYEILEIFPDKSQENEYRFEVKKCVSPAFPTS